MRPCTAVMQAEGPCSCAMLAANVARVVALPGGAAPSASSSSGDVSGRGLRLARPPRPPPLPLPVPAVDSCQLFQRQFPVTAEEIKFLFEKLSQLVERQLFASDRNASYILDLKATSPRSS